MTVTVLALVAPSVTSPFATSASVASAPGWPVPPDILVVALKLVSGAQTIGPELM